MSHKAIEFGASSQHRWQVEEGVVYSCGAKGTTLEFALRP